MFQAHQTRNDRVRQFRAVVAVSRLLGREPKPALDGVRSSLFPIIDLTLPFWVSTDRQTWATTEDKEDAIAFAKRLASILQPGERVVVTESSRPVWTGASGWDYTGGVIVRTFDPCDDCHRTDGTHDPEVEH